MGASAAGTKLPTQFRMLDNSASRQMNSMNGNISAVSDNSRFRASALAGLAGAKTPMTRMTSAIRMISTVRVTAISANVRARSRHAASRPSVSSVFVNVGTNTGAIAPSPNSRRNRLGN